MELTAISMEEADFMANLFSSSSFNNNNNPEISSLSSFYSDNGMFRAENSSFYATDGECSESYSLSDADQFLSTFPIEFCLDTKGVVQVFPGNPIIERNNSLSVEMSCDSLEKSGIDMNQPQVSEVKPAEVGRKRHRNSEPGKTNTRSKRNRKKNVSDNDDNSSCSSEKEPSSENSNAVKTKTRASRGSATDPQSLYARKRRERINDRLRTLQRLVPNGTKVDLSTMLEEAVSYVKFLQHQIKLLSSDDLWMYTPLAYNGMDIGLDAKLNSLLD